MTGVLSRALPTTEELQRALNAAYAQALPDRAGVNASYIPALAEVPEELFGLTVVTVDGRTLEVGDSRYEFPMESISKVLSMALVMEELGPQALHQRVGAGATGLPFNSVLAIELHQGKPLSPLVNAGALATISLLPAGSAEERWQKLLQWDGVFAGRPLRLMPEVYQSETATNHRNRGMSLLLYSYGTLYADPLETCDVYTRQCSVAVTAFDLAAVAATLAGGGVHPLTEERVCQRENIPHMLAEMTMEGLYDASGDWAFKVGLPSKSGVGGGVLAVAPGLLGMAAFSPRLDAQGNSVRALHAVQSLAQALQLNVYAV